MITSPKKEPRLDRIYRLNELRSHCETDWLDKRLFIPPWANGETVSRRIWLAVPAGDPTLAFEDARLEPKKNHQDGEWRWLDYGVADIPCGPTVLLRIWNLPPGNLSNAHLVISTDLELDLHGRILSEAQRAVWGISRAEVGRTAVYPNRIPAGRPATFNLEYTAGEKGLDKGYLLRFSVPRMFSRPQTEDSKKPGYLQITHADAELELCSIDLSFESHERVNIVFRLQSALPQQKRIHLTYQTDITYLFVSVWNRDEMTDWYSPVPPLATSVSTGDPECWVYPEPGNGHTIRFDPGEPERLHLFLPGRRCQGQPLTLRGLATDRFRNPVDMKCADWQFDLYLDGAGDGRFLSLADAVWTKNGAFSISLPELSPGVYRVLATARTDGRIIARSNPLEIIPADQPQRQLFWGHLHNHSERSDGVRTFRQLFEHGRDIGMLDFLAAADHEGHFSDNDWLQMQDIINGFHNPDPGTFCTLCGFEWKDLCVYSWRDRLERPSREATAIMPVYGGREDVLIGPHGHVNHLPPLDEHDENLQCFMQVYGTFGGCDAWDNPFLNPMVHSRNKPETVATDILREGYKLGFTGGGDIHSAHPGLSAEVPDSQGKISCDQYHSHLFHDGLTAAVMPALDRKSLVEAVKNRRTYATSGPRILLDFSVSGVPMGAEGAAHRAECRLSVHAVDELAYVDIVKDGTVVWKHDLSGLDIEELIWTDPDPFDVEHFYYLRVRQRNGEMAWSSPVWIRPDACAQKKPRTD